MWRVPSFSGWLLEQYWSTKREPSGIEFVMEPPSCDGGYGSWSERWDVLHRDHLSWRTLRSYRLARCEGDALHFVLHFVHLTPRKNILKKENKKLATKGTIEGKKVSIKRGSFR